MTVTSSVPNLNVPPTPVHGDLTNSTNLALLLEAPLSASGARIRSKLFFYSSGHTFFGFFSLCLLQIFSCPQRCRPISSSHSSAFVSLSVPHRLGSLAFNFAYGVFFHIEVLVFEAVKFISFL